MIQPTIVQLKERFAQLGYVWLPFQGVAIRSRANKPNKFDDLVGFIDRDSVTWNSGTTNAGTKPLIKPSNPNGVALLCPGQYIDAWQYGLHKGVRPAWKQVKPVKFWRDNDCDAIAEAGGVEYTGIIGANWHDTGKEYTVQNVENFSEGCIVQNVPEEWEVFIRASTETGLEYYTGTILDEWL